MPDPFKVSSPERRGLGPRSLSPSEGMKGPMPVPVPTGACPSRGVAVPSAVSQSCGAMRSRLPFTPTPSPPGTAPPTPGVTPGCRGGLEIPVVAEPRSPPPRSAAVSPSPPQAGPGRRGGAARGMRARGREWEWAPVGSAGSRLGSDRESTCWRREEPRVERGHAALPRVRGAQERVSVCVCVCACMHRCGHVCGHGCACVHARVGVYACVHGSVHSYRAGALP